MRKSLVILLALLPIAALAENRFSTGSVYFGQVPAGSTETRNLRICSPQVPTSTDKFSFSNNDTANIFTVSKINHKGKCLHLLVTFTPPADLSGPYKVYGLPDAGGGDRFRDQIFYQGNRLRAHVDGKVIDLVPVMGMGVSLAEWNQAIAPSGWRYAGYVTFRNNNSDNIPSWHSLHYLGFTDAAVTGRYMHAINFRKAEVQVFLLDNYDIPQLPLSDARAESPLNRPHWLSRHRKSNTIATLGLSGETTLWRRHDKSLQQIFQRPADEQGILINIDNFKPVFDQSGNCLLAPHTDGQNLSRFLTRKHLTPRELEPHPVASRVWGLSSNDRAFAYSDRQNGKVYECSIDRNTCDITQCNELQPSDLKHPTATAFSPDGKWLAAASSCWETRKCELINLWERESGTVINLKPDSTFSEPFFVNTSSLQFHKNSNRLLLLTDGSLRIYDVSEEGKLKKEASFAINEKSLYSNLKSEIFGLNSMTMNEAGDRVYVSVGSSEGGFLMFDLLDDGKSRFITNTDE